MKKLLVLFAVCSVAVAMVPREKRALNEDEVPRTQPPPSGTSSTTAKPKEVCAATTPCAWSIYHPVTREIQTNLSNTYCNCSTETVCTMTEDDNAINTYVFHCRPPSDNDDNVFYSS